ncbi:MAG: hypothetical protein E7Z86_01170 [Methanosphaera stadtmanae]|jgi:uncharacterized protein YcgL (UPF0745 family)|nr:hypothetical protein [Methanosphaera stadtmanae]
MDAITVIIMIVLFVLAMVFVFSTALLTPYIGKKNLISVILLGLVVGIVGGAFLIAPMVGDLPDVTRAVVEESVEGTDNIKLELSTNGNLTEILNNISSITGVEKVSYDGISFKINEAFETPADKTRFLTYLQSQNSNITDVKEVDNETFYVYMADNTDPQSIMDTIYYSFGQQTYIHLKFTSMQADATVKANNVTKVMKSIEENGAVILNVTGPTEDMTHTINKYIPNEFNAVLLSGLLGVIVAIAGFFVDSIYNFITRFRKRNKNRTSDRERIKRKVVPGTERRQTQNNRHRAKGDSIDIFDDSFDQSPKQTIGSNRKFKQLSKDDFKEKSEDVFDKSKKAEKSGGRFSSIKGKFGKSKNKDSGKNDKRSSDNKDSSSSKTKPKNTKRKAPRVKPKRKQ